MKVLAKPYFILHPFNFILYPLSFILLTLSFILYPLSFSHAQSWQEFKGEHFIVYHAGDEAFAKNVSVKAEDYYKSIATELGYPRYSQFWIWDNRVKIYIYQDHQSFLKATGQPDWSHGMANYTDKTISSYIWGQGFTESLLPHEVAHLIFRDFVGFKGQIPLWLDEGVAQWSEEIKRTHYKSVIKKAFNDDSLILLDDMMKTDIQSLEDNKVYIRQTKTVDGEDSVLFFNREGMVNAYYLQAVSLVGFLIEKHGSKNFAEFCRQLREGKLLNEALKFSYPTQIRNIQEFEDRWREYLKSL